MFSFIFIFKAFFLCISIPACADEVEYRLTNDLLDSYDRSVRPAKNYSHSLQVVFGVSLHHIIDVDEKNQVLTTNCWITQVWNDYQLEWNKSDYSGIQVIRIPYEKVWRPDVILYNNADGEYNSAVINTNVIVRHSGEVTWLSHGIYRSSCDIDVEYFPFDIQTCTLKWASWTYDGYQVDLVKQTEEGDISNYQANGEFDLISFDIYKNTVNYSCCSEPYPDISYEIKLRRRPLFYVFNLILPCILINCIALLVFYVPSESGEKVTLGISALLSMTVFLMTIRESLPPTEKTPLISLYYGVSICLVTFASALSVVTLNIYHRGVRGTKVPQYVRSLVLNKLATILLLKFDTVDKAKVGDSSKNDQSNHFVGTICTTAVENVRPNNNDQTATAEFNSNPSGQIVGSKTFVSTGREQLLQIMEPLNELMLRIRHNESRLSEHEEREVIEREWKQVSLVCDRLLLFIFLIITGITTTVILSGSPYGSIFVKK